MLLMNIVTILTNFLPNSTHSERSSKPLLAPILCGNVICILNGLDECNEDSRNLLIDALVAYYSRGPRTAETSEQHVKFLITSRPYPTIERFDNLQSNQQYRLRAENETTLVDSDIERVVKVRVQEFGSARGMTPFA